LKRDIRKTFVLVVVGALLCAALADILSIADAGWVISWSIPLFTGMMLTRMNGIRDAEKRITEARTEARREIVIIQQRLRQLGVRDTTGIGKPGPLSSAKSYVGTYIRDTVIAQVVEVIPVLGTILPAYLGQVVKMMIDQNGAYRKALLNFRALEAEHRTVQALQRAILQTLQRRMLLARLRSLAAPVRSIVNAGRALATA
jgi:hypothetical protein